MRAEVVVNITMQHYTQITHTEYFTIRKNVYIVALNACMFTHGKQYKSSFCVVRTHNIIQTLLTLNTHILLVICDDSVIQVAAISDVCF